MHCFSYRVCRVALLIATTTVTACADGRIAVPFTGSGAAEPARSWVDPAAARNDLLYATGADQGTAVHIFTYPQGTLIGSLTGFESAAGECTDAAGDVFVVDEDAEKIYRFAHGSTTPETILDDSYNDPDSCAVDPMTGDLAVTNLYGYGGEGSVSIFKNASGPAKIYRVPKTDEMWYSAYDGAGNLYADGTQEASRGFRLMELPKGGKTFSEVKLNRPPGAVSGLQWDGQYLAVGDQDGNYSGFVVYRTSGRKTVSTVVLNAPVSIGTFFILGKTILMDYDGVQIFEYPAGGDRLRKLKLIGSFPRSVLVSKGT